MRFFPVFSTTAKFKFYGKKLIKKSILSKIYMQFIAIFQSDKMFTNFRVPYKLII